MCNVCSKSDAELVLAARQGDIGSFGELYVRHYAFAVGVAYAVLGESHAAEDAAQEAFVAALRGLARLKRPGEFASWLRAICRNLARDMARSRTVTAPAPDAPAPGAEDRDEDVEQAVRRSVDRLPQAAREVVLLRYYSGLSHEEIAVALGLSSQAVHGRLVRARRKLAQHLGHTFLLKEKP